LISKGIDKNAISEVLSLPFKSKNTFSLTKNEFIYTLSFDLGLFPPSTCEKILEEGVKLKLVSVKENIVRPSVKILSVKNKINYLKLKKIGEGLASSFSNENH